MPAEVTTDLAAAYPRVLDELIPSALHTVERYANNPAVDDGLIKRNPCRIRGGGPEKSAERPVLTIAQVGALADAAGPDTAH